MTDFALIRDLTPEDHSVVYEVSTELRDILIQFPFIRMDTDKLNGIKRRLELEPSPGENEGAFDATQVFYYQKWTNNTLEIKFLRTPQGNHELHIKHIGSRYNPERFRERINSIIQAFVSIAAASASAPTSAPITPSLTTIPPTLPLLRRTDTIAVPPPSLTRADVPPSLTRADVLPPPPLLRRTDIPPLLTRMGGKKRSRKTKKSLRRRRRTIRK